MVKVSLIDRSAGDRMVETRSFGFRQIALSTAVLFLISVVGTAMIAVRYFFTGQPAYLYLPWNLFLSWIPFGISIGIYYGIGRRKQGIATILTGLIWLLFYPNAPYMITDFIHISRGQTLIVWYDFVILSLFITTSLIIGFISLYLIHRFVTELLNSEALGWVFAIGVSFLSGFGIYLGRVIRWNSWDAIFKPMVLLNSVLDNLHYTPFVFSLLFGTFLILTYIAMYSLTRLNNLGR